MKPRYLQSPNAPRPQPPGVQSPATAAPGVYRRTSSAADPRDDSENLNPEDVHKSLRSTANAIQNYSFDSPGMGILNESKMRFDLLDGSAGSPALASAGASSASKGTPTLEEKMRLLDISGGSGRASVDRFSPARNGDVGGDESCERGEPGQLLKLLVLGELEWALSVNGFRSLPRNLRASEALWQERRQLKEERLFQEQRRAKDVGRRKSNGHTLARLSKGKGLACAAVVSQNVFTNPYALMNDIRWVIVLA